MARKTAEVPDPVAARVAVLNRVRSRRPADKVRTYQDAEGGPPVTSRIPADADRLPPRDLTEWCDDRELACFGGRTRLNDAEQAAYGILEAMRGGDQEAVRRAVKAAGDGLDGWLRSMVYSLLEQWRGAAPSFAVDVAVAATGEARRLGWDVQPRRQRRRAA